MLARKPCFSFFSGDFSFITVVAFFVSACEAVVTEDTLSGSAVFVLLACSFVFFRSSFTPLLPSSSAVTAAAGVVVVVVVVDSTFEVPSLDLATFFTIRITFFTFFGAPAGAGVSGAGAGDFCLVSTGVVTLFVTSAVAVSFTGETPFTSFSSFGGVNLDEGKLFGRAILLNMPPVLPLDDEVASPWTLFGVPAAFVVDGSSPATSPTEGPPFRFTEVTGGSSTGVGTSVPGV
uniref:Uncharacterized protein n=1 Tax=Anopheles darlingi TaxID=43151 RepID=A0A2M4DE59_ANODA